MNEQLIGDLFVEAQRQMTDSSSREFSKKFAELIVAECVSTLNEMHMWQSVNNQNYPSAWHDAVDNGIETIKEHFGVEE